MAEYKREYEGVGEKREISGKLYYPICYRFQGQEIINTSVKAQSPKEAYDKLKAKIADYHSKPKPTGDKAGLESAREELRKDVSNLSNQKDANYLWKNIFTRLFIDFPKASDIETLSCLNLPKGFFRKYRFYFCETIGRRDGWRAEIIRIKGIIKRLEVLGYCSEDDLKQVRGEKTPEGIPRPKPKVSNKQVEKLLEYAKKHRVDYYRPMEFIRLSGKRAGETCSINIVEDVFTDGFNPLCIQTKPKSAKDKNSLPKPLYLKDPELNALVRSAVSNNKTDWLFPTRHGNKMTPNYLWKYYAEISDKVLGIRLTPHGLRKIFLTIANEDGLSLASMDMANIKSVAVMSKYYVGSYEKAQTKLLAKMRGNNV